ncbi:MAG: DUF4286 family protein [Burkholderiales bacterium]|nr:DUF4286 family protein [Burkholderiales bacterium]
MQGLLSVWNDIDADDEAAFNAWYHEEHLGERLAMPGILSARRYRSLDRPRAYAALYDTDGLEPLRSPAYLKLLANPTPRTQAIMPRFRNMVRAASEIHADLGDAAMKSQAGTVLAIAELGADGAGPAGLKALESKAAALFAAGSLARVRLAVPDEKSTRVPNPEARLREKPDALPAPFLLVEGAAEDAVRAAAAALARALGAPREPRLYALIEARVK